MPPTRGERAALGSEGSRHPQQRTRRHARVVLLGGSSRVGRCSVWSAGRGDGCGSCRVGIVVASASSPPPSTSTPTMVRFEPPTTVTPTTVTLMTVTPTTATPTTATRSRPSAFLRWDVLGDPVVGQTRRRHGTPSRTRRYACDDQRQEARPDVRPEPRRTRGRVRRRARRWTGPIEDEQLSNTVTVTVGGITSRQRHQRRPPPAWAEWSRPTCFTFYRDPDVSTADVGDTIDVAYAGQNTSAIDVEIAKLVDDRGPG